MPVFRRVPAILAWAVLAAQVAIPWTVPHYVTQDGPSHVYGATVIREILVHHSSSIYSNLYTIQRTLAVPNSTSTIVLAIATAVAGPAHAEAFFASFALLAGFLAWGYAMRALDPEPWMPLANFVIQTWFLWTGFYNFYLGMVLLPVVIGMYIRYAGSLSYGSLSRKRALAISIGFLALFYTHFVAAVLTVIVIITLAFWMHVVIPFASGRPDVRQALRQLGISLAIAAPVILLIALFVHAPVDPLHFDPQIASAWNTFPRHAFLSPGERFDDRTWLVWPVLIYIAVGILLMRKKEWLSARGGLAVSALLTFLIYLVVPDTGLGGEAVKIRFAWGVFLLASLAAGSVSRLRIVRVPAALYVALVLAMNIAGSAQAARAVSNAAEDYLSTANQITPRSSLVRIEYAAPSVAGHYGYNGIGWDPLFHLDALVAASRDCLDLSDYEALSKIFPTVYKTKVDRGQQFGLWSFENPDPRTDETLVWLMRNFNVPLDYVFLIGDETSSEAARQGMPRMIAFLDKNMQLVATSPGRFLRVYRRNQ